MKILLTYALPDGPRVRILDTWVSTSAAVAYAISLGAVVAIARVEG